MSFLENNIVRIVDWHPGFDGRIGEIIDRRIVRDPMRHEEYLVELIPDYHQIWCRGYELTELYVKGLKKCS